MMYMKWVALMTIATILVVGGRAYERSIWQTKQAEVVAAAIEVERDRQRGVNSALQKQADTTAATNSDLLADINELRKRPVRVRTVIYPGTDCKIQYAEGLSIGRAESFTRLGADCNTERAAKIACYEAYDSLSR